jgi:hypothetical protein
VRDAREVSEAREMGGVGGVGGVGEVLRRITEGASERCSAANRRTLASIKRCIDNVYKALHR